MAAHFSNIPTQPSYNLYHIIHTDDDILSIYRKYKLYQYYEIGRYDDKFDDIKMLINFSKGISVEDIVILGMIPNLNFYKSGKTILYIIHLILSDMHNKDIRIFNIY